MTYRNNTKIIKIGDKVIGGGNPILIQSMTNTETSDIDATVKQIKALEDAGCDIVRCTANTLAAARAFDKLKEQTSVPLVADIHFNYNLAIEAIEHGADKIRINPGNIGGEEKLKAVVEAAKKKDIPIRVGVNSGSLEQQFIDKYHGVSAEGIVESALDKVRMIEEQDYDNIVISIKSSDVLMSVKTHQLIAERTKYPLHVGITESGTLWSGNIKSSVGLGIILNQGIGDTIRVSLTGDPVEEVKTGKLILKTLGLRNDGITLVSCPTCGRTHIDLIGLAEQTEKLISNYSHLNIKVAVMGCAVNGPGEAREADLGIAGGEGEGLIFKKGEILRKVPQDTLLAELKKELDSWE
ncbi:MAG: flavodoxin-dependent (E)-4-hydroxy-3-methylbut-2-enyl-diphosphate synthase [Eubacterium sp.]|nr:flavodoxin-dependent (E)-4-hydroxy-3-methylbut-2-enyl-diphosphate synthase [Eubacterium sp.]